MPPPLRSGPAPRKALGQHFLRDTGVLQDIVDALNVPEGALVLEIGAGTGQLTEFLLAKGFDVLALEVEERLVRHLEGRFRDSNRLRIVPGDARIIEVERLIAAGQSYVAVAHLPYFAANPIIRHFLKTRHKPLEMVVMVQREVAREIAARNGSWSLLSISVQVYAEPELLFDVPPEAFDPPPAVVSSVVRMKLRPQPLVPLARIPEFFEFVSKVFRNPRKQIHNSLSRGVWLPPDGARIARERAALDPMPRPETLDIADWLRLLDACEAVRASA